MGCLNSKGPSPIGMTPVIHVRATPCSVLVALAVAVNTVVVSSVDMFASRQSPESDRSWMMVRSGPASATPVQRNHGWMGGMQIYDATHLLCCFTLLNSQSPSSVGAGSCSHYSSLTTSHHIVTFMACLVESKCVFFLDSSVQSGYLSTTGTESMITPFSCHGPRCQKPHDLAPFSAKPKPSSMSMSLCHAKNKSFLFHAVPPKPKIHNLWRRAAALVLSALCNRENRSVDHHSCS
ncbi:hypothetical protein EDB81DRAFT_270254 [Dactylonectria macrodidyma]|uniref:Uncharacterized protein n=1 Tax=Dactylonectria macrodidyma TaxID=307937 RepID=A0A9P9FN41_9HYPO|nr:hypothetical protein EDB81DRAFT_270254 [Dactylonectria macrodidyma]